MEIFKISFWVGLATGLRLLTSFVVVKILAALVGPAGFALIAQFQNFVSMVLAFTGSLIQSGVVKYVAEFKENPAQKAKILSTALWICIISSAVIGLILFFYRDYFALLILKQKAFSWLMAVFAVTLVLYVLNAFVISILNGEKEAKLLSLVNMGSSILGLILTFILAYYYKLDGALLAQVLNQSVVFLFSLILVAKTNWFRVENFCQRIDKKWSIKLGSFAFMGLVSAILQPLMQLGVRQGIVSMLSWQDAGYWQAVTKISDAYLMLIVTVLSVYYLPKLSSLTTWSETKQEVKKAYMLVFPCVIFIALIIFFFRHQVILLLFTRAFLPMQKLFFFQLIGDVLKIGSWLMAYNMVAKAMTKWFICSEVFFNISFYGLSILFVYLFGLQGAPLAFAVNYFFYWLFVIWVCNKKYAGLYS